MLGAGRKLLLVIDQFEQWLHARRGEEDSELIAALRQCDGEHVQAIVLVRDDFWLAVSRFLADLEVELIQGHNTAAGRSLRHAARHEGAHRVWSGPREFAGEWQGDHQGPARSSWTRRSPSWRRKGKSSRCGWHFSPRW